VLEEYNSRLTEALFWANGWKFSGIVADRKLTRLTEKQYVYRTDVDGGWNRRRCHRDYHGVYYDRVELRRHEASG